MDHAWLSPFDRTEGERCNVSEPNREEANDHGRSDIPASLAPCATAHECERLKTKGRERRVTAAHAGHRELARRGHGREKTTRPRETIDEANDKATGVIDDQRPPRERLSHATRHQPGQPVAADPSEPAAQ